MVSMAGLGGCARQGGPDLLRISSGNYHHAFDAAIEATRKAGMPAVLRDRRGGVIETEAGIAGSLIEPWRTDNASFEQGMENTIAFQRRRARFEFVPLHHTGVSSGQQATDETAALDLTSFPGDLELRVWVFVERANAPGFRRAAWTRRTASRAGLGDPIEQDPSVVMWSPVARDRAYEQRLLAAIERGFSP